MRRFALFPLLFLGSLLLTCRTDSPTQPDTSSPLDQQINSIMLRDGIPSIAGCIIKEDSIVWQNFYGLSDIAANRVPNAETIYILASISKTITATAVMQLYEQGLIDLDTDINSHLPFELRHPKFPDIAITPRILMTHRAGLAWPDGEDPNFYSIYPGDSAPALGPWLEAYLLPEGEEYVAAMWKDTAPGQIIGYSNVGAAVLGYLVEVVAGQDFGEYCKQHIFDPLEMFDSGFKLADIDRSKLAKLYYNLTTTEDHYSVKFYPATTVRSSIKEFSHFVIAILNGGVYRGKRILQQSTVDEMLRYQFPGAGLTLMWWSHGGGWLGHTGGFVGVSSSMDIYRSTKTGVLIFCNRGGMNAVTPGGEIYTAIHEAANSY